MMQVTKVWWDGEKLMAEPIDSATIYQEPAQQEPFDSAPKRMKPFLAMHGIAPQEFNAFHVGFCCGEDFVKEQPAQRTWVGLTDDEKQWITESEWTTDELVEWIEAKLKEKNI